MSARNVYMVDQGKRVLVGSTVKYVGATARTMGSDPAWAGRPENPAMHAAVFSTYSDARDYVISCALRARR